MKNLHRVAFILSIISVIIMWYLLFFTRLTTLKGIIEEGSFFTSSLFALYWLGTLFYIYTFAFCVFDIFKRKKGFGFTIGWILVLLFLPLVGNLLYFEKYIFNLYFFKQDVT